MTRPGLAIGLTVAAGVAVPLVPLTMPYWGAIGDVLNRFAWVPLIVFWVTWCGLSWLQRRRPPTGRGCDD